MKKQEMKTEYIANTNKQPLDKHLLAIAYLTQLIYEKLDLNTENNANMKVACYAAGFFHDIGKLDPGFQKWIKEKSKTKNPDENSSHQDLDNAKKEKTWDSLIRHNEISWLLCKLIAQTNNVRGKPCLVKENLSITDLICYGVYWHHEEKIRNDKKSIDGSFFINSLKNDKIWDELLKIFEIFSESIKTSMEIQEIFVNLNKDIEKLDSTMPKFKTLDTQEDINNSLIRACLIEADRKISKLSCNELMKLFNEKSGKIEKEKIEELLIPAETKSSLKESIEKRIKELEDKKNNKYFDESRNKAQLETANSLAEKLKKGYAILQGPAGVGKTNISLMTALQINNCKKIIYVCPRVQVCQQNYNAIKQELPRIKTQIFTGEYKFVSNGETETEIEEDEFLNADVVVTTIDQIASLFLNHLRSPKLLSLLEKNTLLVFDEFHELSGLPGHYPSFKEIINLKRKINSGCGALFMSATPNPIFLCDALSLSDDDKPSLDIVKIESFNKKPITIKFTEEPILSDKLEPREIAIYNLIDDLQNDFIVNSGKEDSLVYHSKFTNNDKKIIFNDVIKYFGKDSIGQDNNLSLRSGPILQASLDISSDTLKTQETSPENFLQRIGRCNRWGISDKSEVVVVLNKRNKNGGIKNSSQKKYLEKNYCVNTTLKFSSFLTEKNKDFETTINELYDLYFEFTEKNKGDYEKDLKLFKEEVKKFYKNNDYFKPVHYFHKNKKTQSVKLAKISLRGLSIYALSAKVFWSTETNAFNYEENNGDYCWLWKPVEISKQIEGKTDVNTSLFLTVSKEDYDVLDLVDQFKSKILKSKCKTLYKKDSYTKYNRKRILDMAQSPETPLLISDPTGELKYEKSFGYWFEYDKDKSRWKGLGLVMISKKENEEEKENE
jgi:CRISPR-associated endonuclease/helicase Cas3